MQACLTLDLEPDYAGYVGERYDAWGDGRLERLIGLSRQYRVPLSIFTVGKSLQGQRAVIERLIRFGAEFHLHSYSHNLKEPDSISEIRKGIATYKKIFQRRPVGYRAPQGRIGPAGWSRLVKEGFLFDASVFPSLWPLPHYFFFPRKPTFIEKVKLLEIPFTTLGLFGVPLTLSWIKLFGWGFFDVLMKRSPLPETLVIGFHLHDLGLTPAFRRLPFLWRLIQGRNSDQGFLFLEKLLVYLIHKGYRWTTMSAVAGQIMNGKTL